MKQLSYNTILKENRELGKKLQKDPFNILVVSNSVVENVREFMEYELRLHGIYAVVDIGGFDNMLEDTLNVKHQILVIWLDTWNLTPDFYVNPERYNEGYLEDLEKNLRNKIDTILQNGSHVPLIVFNSFVPAMDYGFGFQHSGAIKLSERLNRFVRNSSQQNLFFFDTHFIFRKLSGKETFSKKQYYLFNSLYSNAFYHVYSHYFKFLALGLTGHTKKVLVTDCDNTLWNGIIGEDGPTALQMEFDSPKGRPFYEVQQMVVTLVKQGAVLCLCSKNNPEEVQNLLDNHPGIMIKEEDIVLKKINWKPKPENIKEIASELNVGLDSIVFWDDSDFEVQMVREMLPSVLSFKVPENIFDYPEFFQEQMGWFFKRQITREDKEKTIQYKLQQIRKKEKEKFSDVSDYLRSLSLEIIFEKKLDFHIDRIAQLTQKTNQFNLSLKRYEASDILNFYEKDNFEVLAFRVKDRFGDYGLTGLCILKYEEYTAIIDTFLLSCRVLGRQIEQAFLSFLIEKLKKENIKKLEAEYITTERNRQVAEFFIQTGFQKKESEKDKIIFFCQPAQFEMFNDNLVKISYKHDT